MAKCKIHERECERCHKIMQAYGNRKYCPECTKAVSRERSHTPEYRLKSKISRERIRANKRLAKEPTAKPVLTGDEVTRLANAEGQTYGEYSAKHGLYEETYRRANNGF